jgi:hypothetical protein
MLMGVVGVLAILAFLLVLVRLLFVKPKRRLKDRDEDPMRRFPFI